jgi:hypothetical protein
MPGKDDTEETRKLAQKGVDAARTEGDRAKFKPEEALNPYSPSSDEMEDRSIAPELSGQIPPEPSRANRGSETIGEDVERIIDREPTSGQRLFAGNRDPEGALEKPRKKRRRR